MQRWTDEEVGRRRVDRLPVIRRWSRSTLHASGVAFYVCPIPLQHIGPFSRVKSPYIIQQITPLVPPQPQRQRPSAAN